MSIRLVSCVFEENFEELQIGLITFSLYLKGEEHLFNGTVNTRLRNICRIRQKILTKNGLSVICLI